MIYKKYWEKSSFNIYVIWTILKEIHITGILDNYEEFRYNKRVVSKFLHIYKLIYLFSNNY